MEAMERTGLETEKHCYLGPAMDLRSHLYVTGEFVFSAHVPQRSALWLGCTHFGAVQLHLDHCGACGVKKGGICERELQGRT